MVLPRSKRNLFLTITSIIKKLLMQLQIISFAFHFAPSWIRHRDTITMLKLCSFFEILSSCLLLSENLWFRPPTKITLSFLFFELSLIFFAFGFTFCYLNMPVVSDLCLPPAQRVSFESIYNNKKQFGIRRSTSFKIVRIFLFRFTFFYIPNKIIITIYLAKKI